MKTKSVVIGGLWLVLPILYFKGFHWFLLWNELMKENSGYFSLNWLAFTVYMALVPVYLYFFFQSNIDKLPSIISLAVALLYLGLNILPEVPAISLTSLNPLIGFFYEALAVPKGICVVLFSAYIIKIFQVCLFFPGKAEK